MKHLKALWIVVLALAFSVTAHAAVLNGKALFEGTPPVPEKIKADADPSCKMMHPDGLSSDAVVVNPNGTLKNVFVYVKDGLPEGQKYATPKEAVKFNQLGCVYTPKVFGIQVGQPLEITNSDDTLHNVHSLAKNNKQFNLGMPIKGMKIKKKFESPEVMIKIKCDVHPWMGASVGVLDHPFYSVTGDDGSFTIKDLPAGTYVVEAWHEKFGAQTADVTIADADQEASFTFKAA